MNYGEQGMTLAVNDALQCAAVGPNKVPFSQTLNETRGNLEETIAMLRRINEALFLIVDQPKEDRPIKCMNDELMAIRDASAMIRAEIESLVAGIGI